MRIVAVVAVGDVGLLLGAHPMPQGQREPTEDGPNRHCLPNDQECQDGHAATVALPGPPSTQRRPNSRTKHRSLSDCSPPNGSPSVIVKPTAPVAIGYAVRSGPPAGWTPH